MDTKDTFDLINDMAKTLRSYADQFERTAIRMKESGDLSYAGEIAGGVANLIQNLRLDLLVTRPIRTYERGNK